jgi:transcriptional regulator with XRE-family HTH domain
MPASNNTFGMTQMEIANKSGLHQSHISKYLNGKSMPTLVNIERIADACNITIEEVSQYLLSAYKTRKAG